MKVRRSGALTNVSHLWDMSSTGALAKSVLNYIANDRSKFTRMSSVNSFNEVSWWWSAFCYSICGTVWYGHYGVVQYGKVWYGTLWCGMVWCGDYGVVQYDIVKYGMMQYGMV